jgi:hypothetical protein
MNHPECCDEKEQEMVILKGSWCDVYDPRIKSFLFAQGTLWTNRVMRIILIHITQWRW